MAQLHWLFSARRPRLRLCDNLTNKSGRCSLCCCWFTGCKRTQQDLDNWHSLRQSYFSWTAIWWAATVTDHGDVFGWSTHAFRKVDMRAQCMCLWSTLQMCATVLLWRYMWVTTAVLKLHLVSSVWEHLLCAQFDKMIGTKMWHFLGETYLVLAYEGVTAQT